MGFSHRERVLAAIRHQPVDRVPAMIWATPEVRQMLLTHFGTDDWAVVEENLGVDGIAHVPLRLCQRDDQLAEQ